MPTSTPDAPLQLPQGILGLRSRRSIPPSERFRENTTEPERMEAVAADSKRPSPASVGERVRCLLRCSLFGSSRCARCSVPDHRGAPVCPRCGSRLCYVSIEGGRAQWLCGGKGCEALISFPAGDPDQDAAADAELAELKREKARVRQRISRARRSARRHQPQEAG